MVRHIVMWKVKNDTDKKETLDTLKQKLEGLKKTITEIVDLEVGFDFSAQGDSSSDIILNTSFRDKADLEIYREHPEHLKVVQIIRSLTIERRVIDYEF